MSSSSNVLIAVQDHLGNLISEAKIRLRPNGEAASGRTPKMLRYRDNLGLFVSEEVTPGDYLLSVTAAGYESQEIRLQLSGQEHYDTVVMGRKGLPYYVQSGRRVYFELDGQKVAALMREPEVDQRARKSYSAGYTNLRKLALRVEQTSHAARELLIFDQPQGARENGAASLTTHLEAAPELLDAGPLLRTGSWPPQFLSRFIELVTEEDLSSDSLAVLIEPFELSIHYQDGHQPTYYLLRCGSIPGPDIVSLPERLMQLDGVRSAGILIATLEETTQLLVPGDPDFALQFHAYVTRLPEAWHRVNAANNAQSFGSADVLVAIHDAGILTTGAGFAIAHPELSGTVSGGALSGSPGLNNNKVLFTFDFRSSPIRPGNNSTTGPHGSWVAGLISAAFDGTVGGVGGAANTRLCSYIFFTTAGARMAHTFDYMAGMDPRWQRDGMTYTAGEPFPAILGTGRNTIPGAGIVNCSHTHSAQITVPMRNALQQITLFGRGRRGVLIFAAAGNSDNDTRTDGRWGENTNVMRVSASSIDSLREEVRMNYSSYAAPGDRVVDFAAPSESQNVLPTIHQPPRMFGLITTDRTTISGDLQTNVALRVNLTHTAVQDANSVRVPPASLGSFGVGQSVIIRNLTNPFYSELHTVAATTAPDTVNLNRNLGYPYTAPDAEIIRLSGATGYSTQFGGTSAAAPQASAIAALMLSVNPALSWLEVRDLMRRTAVPINLRHRGSRYGTGIDFRYKWLDPSLTDLITAEGLLDIIGGNKTISVGPVNQGDRFLTLDNVAGIQPRQALLIGAETKLTGVHPRPPFSKDVIFVGRTDEFDIGDTLLIGKNSQTVLIDAHVAGDTILWVQSVDGFLPGDDVTIGSGAMVETVRITAIQRMSAAPAAQQPVSTGDAESGMVVTRLDAAGAPVVGGLANGHARATTVVIANTQLEGPLTVIKKEVSSLTVSPSVTRNHPDGRIVQKVNTEIKAVIRVIAKSNQVEVDSLDFPHPFNAGGVEHVRVGRVASYSLAFGHGRVDALEAVTAAQSYTHDERDLMIRNFPADDGVTNTGWQEVESPDIWVRNDAPTQGPSDPDDHEHPAVTVDPAIFIGTGPNDLEVSGACTSVAEVTLTIEIDATGTPDTFKWNKDGGAETAGLNVTGAVQVLSDGVRVLFASNTGHALHDKWIVKARQIANRFLHVRVRNRGSRAYFLQSTFNPVTTWAPGTPTTALDVARSRLLLCLSDGFPVCRFSSIASAPGNNDLEVVAAYMGAVVRALYTVEITATAAAGDTFRWYRDGAAQPKVALTAGTLTQPLNDGVQIRFGSHTGHAVGDRWDIYARSGASAFLNIDHYWEYDERTAFDPSASGRAGTRIMTENAISGLGAAAIRIDSAAWPESLRPATNSPNRPKPTRPLRLFALGEVVPHDGKLSGFMAETNNNFSFRELVFAKFHLTQDDAETELDTQVDVDNAGNRVSKGFRVQVRATAGTFAAERVRVKLTARKNGGLEENHEYLYDTASGNWRFDPSPPGWGTLAPPLEARRPDGTQPVAVGEQHDVHFDGTYSVDKSFHQLEIEARILSSFRDFPVAKASHTVDVHEFALSPAGFELAQSVTWPPPASFAFSDMASLTQDKKLAFGPVYGSETTRYRTTSLFRSATEIKAYAVTLGFVMVQRDPVNGQAVNLILRPWVQPVAGSTPVRYFIYRGLRSEDFFAGDSGADAKKVRPQAGASKFIAEVWTTFLKQNPGATEMPSTVLGYNPEHQTGEDRLDDIFFRVGASTQLPPANKGTYFGRFLHDKDYNFGFEIVLENGSYEPNLSYARLASHEIEPSGTDTEKLAYRIGHDEILNFMDPAAFYGLHLDPGGKVEVAGYPTPLTGEDIFNTVIDKFHTKHKLYVDIRSENGSSLNFYRNYGTGSGNQVRIGDTASSLTPQAYGTHGWPILILDRSAAVNTNNDHNEIYLRLQIDDNEKPVLYIDHGQPITPVTHGRLVRDKELRHGTDPWTKVQGFRFPNTGPGGAKLGIAWMLRLLYGRLKDSHIADSVLKTESYTDNVFGPIDRGSRWAGDAGIRWFTTQDKRYVDADNDLGWRQVMECGIALQTSGTSRVLLYAEVGVIDTNSAPKPPNKPDFVPPTRSIADGVSDRSSFFDVRGLFGAYFLEHDQVDDGSLQIRTLQLRLRSVGGYLPTNALLLGLERTELDTLKALSSKGISSDYLRQIRLDGKTSHVSTNGKSYDKYRLGIQGLRATDGKFETEFPKTDIHVYTVDGHFFYTSSFAEAENLPTVYDRNAEEEKGTRQHPKDPTATVEDYYIDEDRGAVISGIGKMRDLVDGFSKGLGAIDNDAAALAVLRGEVNDWAAKVRRRAQLLAQSDRTRSEDHDRMLYWARVCMLVALKSHPFCLASLPGRNELVDLFEARSRGYDVDFSGTPTGAKRVLLTGFDPFSLVDDLERTNPAGSVALALHGQTISSSVKDAYVEAATFPVRYRDFDAGRVETLVTKFLTNKPSGNGVDMILTLSQNGGKAFYDVERFAGRRRSGSFDNELVRMPPQWLGRDKTYKEFFETTLPVAAMVPGPSGSPLAQDLFFDQSYKIADRQNPSAVIGSEPHPRDGGTYDNKATISIQKGKAVKAFEGSGGSYLSNEIFYRVARLRTEVVKSTTLTGHFHLPAAKSAGVVIENVIEEVENLIKNWLKSL